MFSGSNVVINQLLKSIWKVDHLEKSILYMLREKNQSNKKWPRLGLLKIRPKYGHLKDHTYLVIKFIVVIIFNPYLFFHHVSYIESL